MSLRSSRQGRRCSTHRVQLADTLAAQLGRQLRILLGEASRLALRDAAAGSEVNFGLVGTLERALFTGLTRLKSGHGAYGGILHAGAIDGKGPVQLGPSQWMRRTRPTHGPSVDLVLPTEAAEAITCKGVSGRVSFALRLALDARRSEGAYRSWCVPSCAVQGAGERGAKAGCATRDEEAGTRRDRGVEKIRKRVLVELATPEGDSHARAYR